MFFFSILFLDTVFFFPFLLHNNDVINIILMVHWLITVTYLSLSLFCHSYCHCQCVPSVALLNWCSRNMTLASLFNTLKTEKRWIQFPPLRCLNMKCFGSTKTLMVIFDNIDKRRPSQAMLEKSGTTEFYLQRCELREKQHAFPSACCCK